jgi:hypothetical protein
MFTGILAMGMLGVALYFLISGLEMRINRHLYLEE